MPTVESATTIDASPSEVRRVLTAAEEHQLWNPFITRITGELTAGGRPTVTRRGFASMNEALRRRVESRSGAR